MRQIARRAVAVSELKIQDAGCLGSARICVTFDDGFSCLSENALPLMRELGVPATVFLVARNLGCPPLWDVSEGHPESEEIVMSVDQIVTAHREGLCRFGSHTLSHPDLSRTPLVRARQELAESKAELEPLLREDVVDLALPYGSYSDGIIEAAHAAGYNRIFTLEPRPCVGPDKRGVVGRFLMSPDVWRVEFLLTCAGAYSWLHFWRNLARRVRGFLATRGKPVQQPE